MYSDNATLVWNGNKYEGKEVINKFFETLPISKTDLRSVDAQNLMSKSMLYVCYCLLREYFCKFLFPETVKHKEV